LPQQQGVQKSVESSEDQSRENWSGKNKEKRKRKRKKRKKEKTKKEKDNESEECSRGVRFGMGRRKQLSPKKRSRN